MSRSPIVVYLDTLYGSLPSPIVPVAQLHLLWNPRNALAAILEVIDRDADVRQAYAGSLSMYAGLGSLCTSKPRAHCASASAEPRVAQNYPDISEIQMMAFITVLRRRRLRQMLRMARSTHSPKVLLCRQSPQEDGGSHS